MMGWKSLAVAAGLAALAALGVSEAQAQSNQPTVVLQTPATTAGGMSHGEYVARAADCVACHSVPGGAAFAGGLKMGTPIGAIYSTNITPDKDNGIGNYTLEDFDRALRKGVAKDGHRLYPAMPYPSYAKLTDDDVKALYDFFMKEVPASNQANKPGEMTGVMAWRWPIAIWDLLFTDGGTYKADSQHDAAWNRGAYLVESLGHCGACHTPRGWAFQETALDGSSSSFLSGALLDAWYAPNLHGDQSTGLGSWSKDDLAQFLKTGHNAHGVVFGSMLDVLNNSTPYMNDQDVDAMATYLKSLPANSNQPAFAYDKATTTALEAGHTDQRGAALYMGNCATCHRADGQGSAPFIPPLAGNPVLLEKDASSVINLVLNGANPIVIRGQPDAYRMPQYRVQMSDQEVADVASFIRNAWGNKQAEVTADQVKTLRQGTDPTSDRVIVLRMR